VLVLLCSGPMREQDQNDMTHYGFRRRQPRRDRRHRRARTARRTPAWEPCDYAPPTGYLCAVKDPTGYIIEFSYGQPLGPQQG
jgi:hypothetical protein